MFIASYNATHETQLDSTADNTGYKIKKGDSDFANYQKNLRESGTTSLDDTIYCSSNEYWWLASPSAYSYENVMFVSGYNGSWLDKTGYSNDRGVRPLVSVPLSRIGQGKTITITDSY